MRLPYGKLYTIFVDLEKVFDDVPKKVIWWALRKIGVMEKEVKAIMETYDGVKTAGKSEWFDLSIGVY